MTTIDALKNLYVELGGNLKDVENINVIPKMIDALSEIAGSTIELPGVTVEDNGDVLTVVDGKWAKAEAPKELPAVTSTDEGNALIVDSEGKWAKSAIPSQLPAVTSADAGDVLTVDSEGKWAKANAGGAKFLEVRDSGTVLYLPQGVKNSDIYTELEAGTNMKIKVTSGALGGLIFEYIGKMSGYHCFSLTYENYNGSQIYNILIIVQNTNDTSLNYHKNELTKVQ